MYELMVIAKTDSSDKVFAKIEKFLKDIDAVSVRAEKLGKKILAYPIAKQTEADYFLYNFEAEANTLKQLADKIRLEQEDILRHMLIKAVKESKELKGAKSLKAISVGAEEEVKVKPKVTVTTKSAVKTKSVVATKKEKKAVKSTKKGKNNSN